MDEVFRALADASRRELLDRLFAQNGQTLNELCERLAKSGASMTRQAVSKHLAILEDANLIATVKRVSSVDFKVELAGRRAGDPTHIVAASDRARAALKWQPRFDDLRTIVTHALAWERKLAMRAT